MKEVDLAHRFRSVGWTRVLGASGQGRCKDEMLPENHGNP